MWGMLTDHLSTDCRLKPHIYWLKPFLQRLAGAFACLLRVYLTQMYIHIICLYVYVCVYIYIYTRLGYTFTCWWLGNHTCVLAVSGGVGCNNVHVHSHIMVMLRYEIVSSIWGGVGLGGVRWCNNIHVHLHWHLMLHCKIFSTVCINTWWYAVRSSLPSALTPDAKL